MLRKVLMKAMLFVVGAACALAQAHAATDYDPPTRVARLAYVAGDVSIAPVGGDTWSVANRNRPLVAGDRLWSGADGRVALDLGGASVRVDRDTAFDFDALDDRFVRVILREGTLNLSVRRMFSGQAFEIGTPTLAFVPSAEGSYRIDIDPDGGGAMITVFRGSGTAYGVDDASRELSAGYSYRFDDADLMRVARSTIPQGNDFDRFCMDLDAEFARSESAQYVADNVIGYEDLDRYGNWRRSADYGAIWYPSQVAVDWAPYRYGHWAWIDPWGWTWVDDAPWGFAPFHYGRWVMIEQRWGWVPGPRMRAAVYAPALVAFVGNVGISASGPVGWFPLGPRDVYLPPYGVSQNYFISINMGGGRFFQRDHVHGIYNDYRNNRWQSNYADYAYRHSPRAVTQVPHDVFTHARPVARANERMTEAMLQQSPGVLAPPNRPVAASFAATPRGVPSRSAEAVFSRDVVTRTPERRFGEMPRGAVMPGAAPGVPDGRLGAPRSAERASEHIGAMPRALPRGDVVESPVTRGGNLPGRPAVEAPERGIERIGAMPRSVPRGGVGESPVTRGGNLPGRPAVEAPERGVERIGAMPRSVPRGGIVESPMVRGGAMPSRPPENLPRAPEFERTAPAQMPRARPNPSDFPVTPRAQPLPREPVRPTAPNAYQNAPRAMPRAQPSMPTMPQPRSAPPVMPPQPQAAPPMPMPRPAMPMPREAPSAAPPRVEQPAPRREPTQDAQGSAPASGMMPRGRPRQ